MATTAEIQAFWPHILPYAQRVAAATGLHTGVIMALTAEETGYGGSYLAQHCFNMSGIKYVGQPQAQGNSGGFACYAGLGGWASDMIRVLQLPFYAGVLQTAGQSAQAQLDALAASPYDGAPAAQRQQWADNILAVYNQFNLGQYDSTTSTPSQPKVTVQGNTMTVTAQGPISGGGAALALVIVLAVASALVANA